MLTTPILMKVWRQKKKKKKKDKKVIFKSVNIHKTTQVHLLLLVSYQILVYCRKPEVMPFHSNLTLRMK